MLMPFTQTLRRIYTTQRITYTHTETNMVFVSDLFLFYFLMKLSKAVNWLLIGSA